MQDLRPGSVSLRRRMIGVLALLAALVVVNGVLGVVNTARLNDEERLEARLRPATQAADRLLGILVDQQSALRGYALTGDGELLGRFEVGRTTEARLRLQLRRHFREDAQLLSLVERVADASATWHTQAVEPAIAARRAGRTEEAARIVADTGEPLFVVVRDEAVTLTRTLSDRLDESRGRVEAATDRLNQQLVVSSLLALLILAGSAELLRRWITRPVSALSAQVRTVAGGQLQQEVRGSGPSELDRLAQDVEAMRQRILSEVEEARRAVEGLEQGAPLVASLRSQLSAGELAAPTGHRIVARFEPATGVLAGDWYDVVDLDEGRAALVVVDVSGHGPEAGLRALWLKHLLVPALLMGLDPGDALAWVAGQIGDTGEWFSTCLIAEFDATTDRFRYANAGHPPALLVTAGGVEELPPTGPLFGAFPGARWETALTALGENQLLVVYTDGITEARDTAGEEFGDERLTESLTSLFGVDADEVADRLIRSVHEFSSGRLLDDVTLAVVSRTPAESVAGRSQPAREAMSSGPASGEVPRTA